MKMPLLSIAALIVTAAFLRADLTIVQKVDGGGQSGEQTIKIKGDKARTDLAQSVSVITDGATGDSITLMHAQKAFMKISAAQSKAMIEQAKKLRTAGDLPKLQPTGKKEKIGDYDCEIFTANLGFVDVTYWIARDYPNYKSIADQMEKLQAGGISAMGKGLMPEAKDFPGMAVKTEMNLSGQKVTTTILSIRQDPLDASIFNVPPTYKEVLGNGIDLQPAK